MAIIDSISIKSPLGGDDWKQSHRQKQTGHKKAILTDKKGIPLSVVISSASTHDIKLVTNVVDSIVIKQRRPSSYEPKSGRRRKLKQHLCLDKAYNSEPEEQELIKRGYVLHIPYKRKKGEAVDEQKTKVASHIENTSCKKMGCGENQFMA